jgi:YegS/Rv2252/BmrU family lipid kinase
MAKTTLKINNDWLVIVNPNAGLKKGEKDWFIINEFLNQTALSFETVFTTHKEHAIALTTKFIKKGFRNFIVVGGDGTLNEVVNGIFYQKSVPTYEFLIAMIPVGTGNDWCRMFQIPFNYSKAIDLIKNGNTIMQDIGRVNYFNSNIAKRRYFINVAGMGYDAEVASKTNKDKERGKGGPLSYLKNLFSSLLFYKFTETDIRIDDAPEQFKNKTFSISVGICKFNGGGMKQLPDAIPDDGLLDMTLIKKLSKFTVIKEVKNLYDGSFIKNPKVQTFRGKSFRIESNPPINLEADGESLGHSPFTFDLVAGSLRIVIGSTQYQ